MDICRISTWIHSSQRREGNSHTLLLIRLPHEIWINKTPTRKNRCDVNDGLRSLEIVEMLGITYDQFRRYRKRKLVPEPDSYIGQASIWKPDTILDWIETNPELAARSKRLSKSRRNTQRENQEIRDRMDAKKCNNCFSTGVHWVQCPRYTHRP